MDPMRRTTDPQVWIDLIFSAKAARGGVIRRSIPWVDAEVGRQRFIAEVRARGFHLIATRTQFVVVCDPSPVQILF